MDFASRLPEDEPKDKGYLTSYCIQFCASESSPGYPDISLSMPCSSFCRCSVEANTSRFQREDRGFKSRQRLQKTEKEVCVKMFYIVSTVPVDYQRAITFMTKFEYEMDARVFCDAMNTRKHNQHQHKVWKIIPPQVLEIPDDKDDPTYDRT